MAGAKIGKQAEQERVKIVGQDFALAVGPDQFCFRFAELFIDADNLPLFALLDVDRRRLLRLRHGNGSIGIISNKRYTDNYIVYSNRCIVRDGFPCENGKERSGAKKSPRLRYLL